MLWVLIRITKARRFYCQSTHNICFYGKLTKIILHLSSNTLHIFFTVQSCNLLWSLDDLLKLKKNVCQNI